MTRKRVNVAPEERRARNREYKRRRRADPAQRDRENERRRNAYQSHQVHFRRLHTSTLVFLTIFKKVDQNSSMLKRREIINSFRQIIKLGPTVECFCCGCLWFSDQTKSLNREKIPHIEIEFLDKVFINGTVEAIFCKTCHASIMAGEMPTIALANGLQFPLVPPQIASLNRVEERLLAVRHVFQSIYSSSGRKGQFKSIGAIQNIPIDFDTTVSVLPRSLNDSHIVSVKLARRMADNRNYMEGNIRPAKVWEAAQILKESSLYKEMNITLDDAWLQEAIEQVAMAAVAFSIEEEDEDEHGFVQEDYEDVMDEVPIGGEETLFTGEDYLRMAPGEGKKPLSLLIDENVDFLAFPKIFCGEPLKPMSNGKPLTYAALTRSVIRRADRRGVTKEYLFFMDRKRLLLTLVKNVNIMMRKSIGNNFTASDALNRDNVDRWVKSDSAYQVLGNVRSSPAYWKTEKSNVMAMIRQLGVPHLFVTLSAAETKWKELIVILKKIVDHETICESQVDDLNSTQIATLIQSDPVTCAQYFDHRFRELKKTWKLPDGPFGKYKLKDFYYRIEFQQRGSPHVHMLVWLEGTPVYTVVQQEENRSSGNAEEVCAFVDEVISCRNVFEDDNQILSELVKTRQQHKHTHTCWKNRRDEKHICRFNIPFFPMDSTCILQPLEELSPSASDEDISKRHFFVNKAKLIKEYLNDVVGTPGENHTFEEFIQLFHLTKSEYLTAVRSTLNTSKVFLKRSLKEILTNNYNPMILEMHQANMDIQYVLDPYACCVYVVDCINKSDKGMSRVLKKVLDDGIKDDAPTREVLRSLTSKYYNVCEISAQEAAYNLLSLRMTECSAVVFFVSTTRTDTQCKMIKKREELERLDEDSTNIYAKGMIDYYALRPDSLEELNLANFCAYYQYHKKKKQRKYKATAGEGDDADAAADEVVDEEDGYLELHDNSRILK